MITKFLSLTRDERLLLIEAVVILFLSKIIVSFPFRLYIRLLRPLNDEKAEPDAKILQKISLALFRANKLAFWKNICLVKSVAARLMLKRRKIVSVLSLGLQFQDGNKLIAHAWIRSGDVYITPKGDSGFKEIFSI